MENYTNLEQYPNLDVEEDGIEDKGAPGVCNHCLKPFADLQKFLRHVTQKKACLDSYDPDMIKELKRNSRLRSRRNWYKRYKGYLKTDRENKKKESGSNYKYISVREKRTIKGTYLIFL